MSISSCGRPAAALGISHATIDVRRRDALERSPSGKLQLVIADRLARVQDIRRRRAAPV